MINQEPIKKLSVYLSEKLPDISAEDATNGLAVWVGRLNNLPDYKSACSGLPIPTVVARLFNFMT
jgi:hypothetical protein